MRRRGRSATGEASASSYLQPGTDADIEAETERLEQALAAAKAPVIVVANEVGSGIVPEHAVRVTRAGMPRMEIQPTRTELQSEKALAIGA